MRKRTPQTLLALAGAALLILWQLHEASQAHTLFGDFRAFYCGAAAVAHGANPYTGSAIYPCESTPMPWGLYSAVQGIAVPAPLPGYALLAFVPLTLLPYQAACILWLFVLLACAAIAARALSLLLDRPLGASASAIVPGIAIVVVPFGELGCIELAALLCMALALRARAWGLAALAGGVAMLLPQVGLPAMLAAFIFLRPMRMRIFIAIAVLAVLDVAGSSGTALAYLFTVLPAHARAEIPSSVQYGVTWMLHALRASDAAALAGGSVSYAVVAILGIASSGIAFARMGDRACCALIAPAFAVFGGTFVHYAHIMSAIPAALLLATRASGVRRITCDVAALLLIVPWLWVLSQPLLVPVVALACGICAWGLLDCAPRHALRIALASVVLAGAILIAGAHFGAGGVSPVQNGNVHEALAQDGWSRFIAAARAGTGAAWWIGKLPTWTGLLLVMLACATMARTPKPTLRQAEPATAASG